MSPAISVPLDIFCTPTAGDRYCVTDAAKDIWTGGEPAESIMIQDLDLTLQQMLTTLTPEESTLKSSQVSFELPDSQWRANVGQLTLNCYLYEIRQNQEMRTNERLIERGAGGKPVALREPPARVDCAYCITAWSPATAESALEEHRLLSEVLQLLLKHRTIPKEVLQGTLATQIPPYPRVIASPDGIKNPPEFWEALDQKLKPSLNYIVTLAMLLDEEPRPAPSVVGTTTFDLDQLPAILSVTPASAAPGARLKMRITGKGTHFSGRSSVAFSPANGIVVNSTTVDNKEQLTADITIASHAQAGLSAVRVTSGAETITREHGFEIGSPA